MPIIRRYIIILGIVLYSNDIIIIITCSVLVYLRTKTVTVNTVTQSLHMSRLLRSSAARPLRLVVDNNMCKIRKNEKLLLCAQYNKYYITLYSMLHPRRCENGRIMAGPTRLLQCSLHVLII